MIRRKEKKKEGEIVPRDYYSNWTSPMALMHDMDRLFDEFRSEWETMFLPPKHLTEDLVRQPLIDVADNGKEYIIKAELPGIEKDDLDIQVTENSIEISAETKKEEKEDREGYVRRERRYSSFYRNIPLPDSILTDKADAELKDGVLKVKLPKSQPEEKKTKKLSVK